MTMHIHRLQRQNEHAEADATRDSTTGKRIPLRERIARSRKERALKIENEKALARTKQYKNQILSLKNANGCRVANLLSKHTGFYNELFT